MAGRSKRSEERIAASGSLYKVEFRGRLEA